MMAGEGELPILRKNGRKKKLTVYYLDYAEKLWYCVVLNEVVSWTRRLASFGTETSFHKRIAETSNGQIKAVG